MTHQKLFCSAFFVFITLAASAQLTSDFNLPEKWDKDFVIELSYSGSMSGSNTHAKFTYDSCIYRNTSNHSKPVSKAFLLKEADRVAIFQKLRETRADKIKSENSVHAVHDGWSQTICFNSFHCIDGGTSAEMTDEDKNAFLTLYNYLEEFATKKRKK